MSTEPNSSVDQSAKPNLDAANEPVPSEAAESTIVPGPGGTNDTTGLEDTADLEDAARPETEPAAEDAVQDEPDRDVPEAEATDEAVPPDENTGAENTGDEDSSGEEASSGETSEVEDVEPLELVTEEDDPNEDRPMLWYILKVQVNREDSIRDALQRRVKIEGLDEYFDEIVVPTEDVAEFTKSGKRRIVKKKLYPGYIMVRMLINDDTWFVVRETPGIGDFTGSAGKPTPMDQGEVERILNLRAADDDGETQIKTSIPYSPGDRVRVKEGYFQNFEGDVESVDEANGRVTVMINIFGRSTPVELEHWQIESV